MEKNDHLFKYRVGQLVWHKQRVVSDNVTSMTKNGEKVPTLKLLDGRHIIERRYVDFSTGCEVLYVFRGNIGYGIDAEKLYMLREDEIVSEAEATAIIRLREANSP